MRDLKENGEYKFRVKAVNEVGESEPLTGDSFIAKDAYSTIFLVIIIENFMLIQ